MENRDEILVIESWANIKLFFHEDRQRILEICASKAFSIKELSIEMDMNPGSIHNHVSKLFNAGYLKITKTREINGIIEKKYLRAAKSFCFAELSDAENTMRNKYISNDIKKESFHLLESDPKTIAQKTKVRLSEKKYQEVQDKLRDLIKFIHESNDSGEIPVNLISCLGVKNETI